MVWARTRLLIWDYIFEPVKRIKINYTGPNPDKFYQKSFDAYYYQSHKRDPAYR